MTIGLGYYEKHSVQGQAAQNPLAFYAKIMGHGSWYYLWQEYLESFWYLRYVAVLHT